MCGIVGYIGNEKAQNFLVEGLEKLEYRGYDSAGIVTIDGELQIVKKKGNVSELRRALETKPLSGVVGIGHTRWATHGKPSDENSHPHLSGNGKFAVVHNGIIENYQEIREMLEGEGIVFRSQTDTEVVAHLLEKHDTGVLENTVLAVTKIIKGAFALGVIAETDKNKLVAVRMASPLVVGIGEHGNYISSDVSAILNHTNKVVMLENGEMAVLNKNSVEYLTLEGNVIQKDVNIINWTQEAAEKNGFSHFMNKEIFEQPVSLNNTMRGRLQLGKVVLNELNMTSEEMNNIKKINIVACGTSYHAGLVGKEFIEKIVKIPVEVSIASEFRYRNPLISENEVTILISQSGETADTMAALWEAKEKGSKIVSITNVLESSIARDSDSVLYTYAGPEIAVASTKAYTSQLMMLYILGLYLAQEREVLSKEEVREYVMALENIPKIVEEHLELGSKEAKEVARGIESSKSLFFLGRGMDYHATLEGSLKLKEISYIHSEAYAAGELKHGTLALIEDEMPVIALSTQGWLNEKTISNVIEVQARGAYVFGIGTKGNKELKNIADVYLEIPETKEEFMPIIAAIPLQLIAFHTSVSRGNNPDRPKNLAKSVTVE